MAEKRTWKQRAGRTDGPDGYKIGDVGRSLIAKTGRLFRKDGRGRASLVGESPENRAHVDPSSSMNSSTSVGSKLEQARVGLETMQEGLAKFEGLDLRHCMAALEKIQQGITELEDGVQECVSHQQTQPGGGDLIKVLVCTASGDEDPPEWSGGLLYVSTETLFFQSTEQQPAFRIGPVKWSDVASLEKLRGSGDIRLSTSGAAHRHLFSGISDMAELESRGLKDQEVPEGQYVGGMDVEVMRSSGEWSAATVTAVESDKVVVTLADGFRKEVPMDDRESFLRVAGAAPKEASQSGAHPKKLATIAGDSTAEEAPVIQVQPPVSEAADESGYSDGQQSQNTYQTAEETTPEDRDAPEEWLASFSHEADDEDRSRPSTASMPLLTTSFLPTKSFFLAADALPDSEAQGATPIFEAELPKANLRAIKRFLGTDKDWPFRLYLEEQLKIFDVEPGRWAMSTRIPGTRMRRMRFMMPVPADVPAAVKKLISLPAHSKVTHLSRLGSSPDRVVMVQEVCTHDVTYGNNFWVQDVLVFSNNPAGGVSMKKYGVVKWVQSLPWYAGVLASFIEMKAKQDAAEAGGFLVKFMDREGYDK